MTRILKMYYNYKYDNKLNKNIKDNKGYKLLNHKIMLSFLFIFKSWNM